jgi:hypothetical protein
MRPTLTAHIPALALLCLAGAAPRLVAQESAPPSVRQHIPASGRDLVYATELADNSDMADMPDAPDMPEMSDLPMPPHAMFAMTMHRHAGVEFFLAHTGELNLTDGQVTKLAAIARRVAERHKAMRASFDSMRTKWREGAQANRDSAGHMHMGMRTMGPPAAMEREHEAEHADLRDAIAVLNPDQLAHAWEIVAAGHHKMMFGPHHEHGMIMLHHGGMPGPGGDSAGPEHRPPS